MLKKVENIFAFEIKIAVAGYVLSALYELAHAPLFVFVDAPTVWHKIYYPLHCALGDLNPFMISYHVVAFWNRDLFWIKKRYFWAEIVVFTAIAVTYTVLAEIIYVQVKSAWSYKEIMPMVPVLGVGLTPFIQWMVVAPAALYFIHRLAGIKANE